VNSIVARCHSAKLCPHAARDFRSQQYQILDNRQKSLKQAKYHKLAFFEKTSNVKVPVFSLSEST